MCFLTLRACREQVSWPRSSATAVSSRRRTASGTMLSTSGVRIHTSHARHAPHMHPHTHTYHFTLHTPHPTPHIPHSTPPPHTHPTHPLHLSPSEGVHGMGGALGSVLVGFFADDSVGGVSASAELVGKQLAAVAFTAAYSYVVTIGRPCSLTI